MRELEDAIKYHNTRRDGLGVDLAREVIRTIERIVENPHAGTSVSKLTRRWLTSRFPYAIFYYFDDADIVITSIVHTKRKPDRWRNREPRERKS